MMGYDSRQVQTQDGASTFANTTTTTFPRQQEGALFQNVWYGHRKDWVDAVGQRGRQGDGDPIRLLWRGLQGALDCGAFFQVLPRAQPLVARQPDVVAVHAVR